MIDALDIQPRVAEALADGRPVVALESTIISHGLPWPENLETAHALGAAITDEAGVPATIAVRGGRLVVGCDDAHLEKLARGAGITKVSRRDLAAVVAQGGDGATTVAGTMIVAQMAGIPIMATGGIGGVHRGAADTFDISADLAELSQTSVAVVCSGAKSILDLPKTLEVLETNGVPVIGFGTDKFPAFHCRDSGLRLEARADTPEDAARIITNQRRLGLGGGLVIANPVPAADEIAMDELDAWTASANESARAQGITGKDLTPYLLDRLADLSGGRTIKTNVALVSNNAAVAARIAAAMTRDGAGEGKA